MMHLELGKYHGLGNDYLVFDPARNEMELTPERIRLICDRNFGVGGDGVLAGDFDVRMTGMVNRVGTFAGAEEFVSVLTGL